MRLLRRFELVAARVEQAADDAERCEKTAPTGMARYAQVIENDSSPLIVWKRARHA